MMVFNDYVMGLLYGDGSFTMKENREFYLFSSVHKELADKIEIALQSNDIRYSRFARVHDADGETSNYETLELVEIYDKRFLDFIVSSGFKSESVEDYFKTTGDFLRGYLETKGTLFQSSQRGNLFWRISFSGSEKEIKYLKLFLETTLDISVSNIVQRNERQELGIISASFRISIQNRTGVAKLVEYIDGEEISVYLKERVEGFKLFDKTTPFNLQKKAFKHYKNAVGFMTREMKLDIRGIRGISIKDRQKPLFLFEDEEIKQCFRNWKSTYYWICEEYESKTGKKPPKVESLK